jgi:2-polyprenyl-3-methyl-5-hydroxy-6-metoxy-1,4-benzoquinol methylase
MNQADYYNTFYRELARIDEANNSLAKIIDLLPPLPPSARVMDIGCGHGSVSAGLVEMGLDVWGMEINQDAVASLKAKGIRAVEHDITRPFHLDEKFDLVLVLDVLEHLFDPLMLLRQAGGLLSEEGRLIVTVPLYFDIIDRIRVLLTGRIVSYDNRCYGRELYRRFRSYNYDHIRFFRPADILEMCALAGFTVEQVRYGAIPAGLFPSPIRLLVRLIANRLTVGLSPNLFAHSMGVRLRK